MSRSSFLRRVTTRPKQNVHPCPPLKVSTMRAQCTVPNYCYPGLTLFTLFSIDTLNQNPPMHTVYIGLRTSKRWVQVWTWHVSRQPPAKKTTHYILTIYPTPKHFTKSILSSEHAWGSFLPIPSQVNYSTQRKCQSLANSRSSMSFPPVYSNSIPKYIVLDQSGASTNLADLGANIFRSLPAEKFETRDSHLSQVFSSPSRQEYISISYQFHIISDYIEYYWRIVHVILQRPTAVLGFEKMFLFCLWNLNSVKLWFRKNSQLTENSLT